jgi:hypothetical protein
MERHIFARVVIAMDIQPIFQQKRLQPTLKALVSLLLMLLRMFSSSETIDLRNFSLNGEQSRMR